LKKSLDTHRGRGLYASWGIRTKCGERWKLVFLSTLYV
jgi:hypothetical protein